MSSDADLSSSPSPNRNPSDGPDSISPEFDPELEALYRASNRDLAATAILRLLIPALLVGAVLAVGTWGYISFMKTRNEFRAKTQGDPLKAMDMLLKATGKEGEADELFSGGLQFDPADFDSKAFQMPSFDGSKKRK